MIVLIMLGIVSIVAATVAMRSQRSMQVSQTQSVQFSAQDTAFSGLQVGLGSIQTTGDSWTGTGGVQAMPQRPGSGYRVFVNSNFSGTTNKIDADGTEIPPKSVYLKSVGYQENLAKAGMTAIVSQDEGATFNYPAFATQGINMSNTIVDAVDASDVPLPDGAPIRTNGDANGAITLDAGTFVDGDVTVGTLGDATTSLVTTGGSGFSGTANVAGSDLPLPAVTAAYDDSAPANVGGVVGVPLPPGMAAIIGFLPVRFSLPAPGTYSSINVDNATMGTATGTLFGIPIPLPQFNILFLQDGDYYASNFTTNDGIAIVLAGAGTRLHVRDGMTTGSSSTSFSASTTTGLAGGPGLQVYQTSPAGSVSLTDASGEIIVNAQGPLAINTSTIKGAVYGTNIDMTDSQLTYRSELDGLAVNANVGGDWSLFGTRQMTPEEVSNY